MPNSPLHPHPLSPSLVLAANGGPIWLCHCKPKLPFCFCFSSLAEGAWKRHVRDSKGHTWRTCKGNWSHESWRITKSERGLWYWFSCFSTSGRKKGNSLICVFFFFIYQFLPMLFVLLGPLRKGKLQYTTLMKGKKNMCTFFVHVFVLCLFFSTVYFEHFCLMFNTCSCWKKESFLVKYLYYIYGSLKQKKGWFILVCIFLLLY